jgi:hypothetical protein
MKNTKKNINLISFYKLNIFLKYIQTQLQI